MKRLQWLMTVPPFLAVAGCVFVEPKSSVKIDAKCGSAYEYAYVGIDSTPGEGLVVFRRDNTVTMGPNIPAVIGSCSNEECWEVLASLGKQLVVETVAAGSYVLAKNIVATSKNHARCANEKKAPRKVLDPEKVIVEDLNQYL